MASNIMGIAGVRPVIDPESEFKISKKKALLLRKIDQLKSRKDQDEATKEMIDQVQSLLDDFEQEYRDTLAKELQEAQGL